MIIAIIVGIIAGLVAIVPFYIAVKNAKKIDPTAGSFSMLGPFLLTIVLSFAILVCALAVGKTVSPDKIVPLAVSEFVAFVFGVIVFGVLFAKGRKIPTSDGASNEKNICVASQSTSKTTAQAQNAKTVQAESKTQTHDATNAQAQDKTKQ